MKITKILLILFTTIALLSAEDYSSFIDKTYEKSAPNGRFLVQAHQQKGRGKFDVKIIELPPNKTILTFDPQARFIGAAWSPDSKFVAIEQNRTIHDSAVSVFSVGKETPKRVILPKGCNYEDEGYAVFESLTRKHAKDSNSQKFHITMAVFQIAKWLDSDTFVLSASGRGWWGEDSAKDADRRFDASYKITLQFASDGTSSLQKIELANYEEL
jgi:hypothetical protein